MIVIRGILLNKFCSKDSTEISVTINVHELSESNVVFKIQNLNIGDTVSLDLKWVLELERIK